MEAGANIHPLEEGRLFLKKSKIISLSDSKFPLTFQIFSLIFLFLTYLSCYRIFGIIMYRDDNEYSWVGFFNIHTQTRSQISYLNLIRHKPNPTQLGFRYPLAIHQISRGIHTRPEPELEPEPKLQCVVHTIVLKLKQLDPSFNQMIQTEQFESIKFALIKCVQHIQKQTI